MSHDLYNYGTLEPVYFKLTLSGVAAPGITFASGDVKVSIDGVAFNNIDTQCTETVAGLGWYKWTPSHPIYTSAEVIIINIKDIAGGRFDENAILLTTGGNPSARFNG